MQVQQRTGIRAWQVWWLALPQERVGHRWFPAPIRRFHFQTTWQFDAFEDRLEPREQPENYEAESDGIYLKFRPDKMGRDKNASDGCDHDSQKPVLYTCRNRRWYTRRLLGRLAH